MSSGIVVSMGERDLPLRELGAPLVLDDLVPGPGPWEVEVGFGKGRYLLSRAEAEPANRFLGIEVAAKYHRILVGRARRRGLGNLVALQGEALEILATALPEGFARALHVYFPDPWPKARHHRRRLFDPLSLDLVLGLLAPGGELLFATDHLEYGEVVAGLLESHPRLAVRRQRGPWLGGPRTNYEAKYDAEGRPILRLVGRLEAKLPLLHPLGSEDLLCAYRTPDSDGVAGQA